MEKILNPGLIDTYLKKFGWDRMFSPRGYARLRVCRFEPGEFLVREGENMDWFFLYVLGKSKIFKVLGNGSVMLIRFYLPFEVIGDVELFQDIPSISFVQAVTPVECLGIPMESMREETDNNPRILKQLCTALGGKLASFNLTSAINQSYPVETRLASYLTVLYLEGETKTVSPDQLKTENLGEMAELLGCSYRQLGRTLKAFREEGILEKRGGTIRITDSRRLRALSRDLYL